ncbi:MAG: hypothetical protein ACJ8GW_03835 [Massilia sp.]
MQALRAQRTIAASITTVLSYGYKAKRAVTPSSPSRQNNGSRVPPLESFDVPGQYAYANAALAQRYADLQMQGREARSQLWGGGQACAPCGPELDRLCSTHRSSNSVPRLHLRCCAWSVWAL